MTKSNIMYRRISYLGQDMEYYPRKWPAGSHTLLHAQYILKWESDGLVFINNNHTLIKWHKCKMSPVHSHMLHDSCHTTSLVQVCHIKCRPWSWRIHEIVFHFLCLTISRTSTMFSTLASWWRILIIHEDEIPTYYFEKISMKKSIAKPVVLF